jgi:hypothetical protein
VRVAEFIGIMSGSLILVMTLVYLLDTVCDDVSAWWERRRAVNRALRAEWRIHQIRGDAQSRMWDEATRDHGGGSR